MLLFNHSVVSDSLQQPHGLQHVTHPCPSPSPGAYSHSCPLSWWCHSTISFSVIAFFFCLQSFQASGSFLMNQLFTSGGQSIGALASVLPVNIQGWFSLGLTGLISLQSKGLSRVFLPTLHWYNYQKQGVIKKLFWPRSKSTIYSEWVNCLIHVLIFVKNIFLMLSQMSNR